MDRLENLLAKVKPVFIFCDPLGKVIFTSGNLEDLLAIKTEEAVGKNIKELLEALPVMEGPGQTHGNYKYESKGNEKIIQYSISSYGNPLSGFEIYLMEGRETTPPVNEVVQIVQGCIHDLKNYLNNFLPLNNGNEVEINERYPYTSIIFPIEGIIAELEEKLFGKPSNYRYIQPEKDIFPVIEMIFSASKESDKVSLHLKNNFRRKWFSSPEKLLRIFANLISNMFKHSGAEVLEISIEESAENKVSIFVRDNGRGFPSKNPEFHWENSDIMKEKSGLGLSIVRNMVNELQGTVIFRNLYPGAEICMEFPLKTDVGLKPEDSKQKDYKALKELLKLKIHVVDDQEFNLKLLQSILLNKVKSVKTYSTGKELLIGLDEDMPDIILLDILLKNENGRQIASEIIQKYRDKTPLLVAVTGFSDPKETIKLLCNGFDYLIQKPYYAETILDELSGIISDKAPGNAKIIRNLKYIEDFNPERIRKINEISNQDISEDLLSSFIKEINFFHKKIISLNNFIKTDDFFRILHTLKSSAGTLGFSKLEYYLMFLETEYLKREPESKDLEYLKTLLNKVNKVSLKLGEML